MVDHVTNFDQCCQTHVEPSWPPNETCPHANLKLHQQLLLPRRPAAVPVYQLRQRTRTFDASLIRRGRVRCRRQWPSGHLWKQWQPGTTAAARFWRRHYRIRVHRPAADGGPPIAGHLLKTTCILGCEIHCSYVLNDDAPEIDVIACRAKSRSEGSGTSEDACHEFLAE